MILLATGNWNSPQVDMLINSEKTTLFKPKMYKVTIKYIYKKRESLNEKHLVSPVVQLQFSKSWIFFSKKKFTPNFIDGTFKGVNIREPVKKLSDKLHLNILSSYIYIVKKTKRKGKDVQTDEMIPIQVGV